MGNTWFDRTHWKIQTIKVSSNALFKYDAVIIDQNNNTETIPFGLRNRKHFRDNTSLKHWSSLDHLDNRELKKYNEKNQLDPEKLLCSDQLEHFFLWTNFPSETYYGDKLFNFAA